MITVKHSSQPWHGDCNLVDCHVRHVSASGVQLIDIRQNGSIRFPSGLRNGKVYNITTDEQIRVVDGIVMIDQEEIHKHVAIVGKIPMGLASPVLSFPPAAQVVQLIPGALFLAVVGYVETIAVANMWAAKFRTYSVSPDSELLALGLGNILQVVMSGVPVMGSLSDTAASVMSGTVTPVAICFRSVWMVIVLFGATPLFYNLPKAVLAVIVILAVAGMVDFKTPMMLARTSRMEFVVWSISCFVTLFMGIQLGMGLSMIVSLLVVIKNAAAGRTNVLGRVEGTNVYKPVEEAVTTYTVRGVNVFDFEAPLWFANCNILVGTLQALEDGDIAVFDMSCVPFVDTTAISAMKMAVKECSNRGILLFVTNVRANVMDVFENSGFADCLTECDGRFFMSVHESVTFAMEIDDGAQSTFNSEEDDLEQGEP
eukprot:gnl/TRDRNA2_/TRDRNA2_171046_c0_seq1.p1 gnl/TRDRNA2_/TRDRNA2_171046_c0~~gnl/TRDRNA2_/TRDRNA2_171046_c0_seq1.p1  ORF type:complete len:427 (+),score=54.36 gnl/TRDRNA2_/TRDRNA2_171046_c0_seq1:1206-2486(+)